MKHTSCCSLVMVFVYLCSTTTLYAQPEPRQPNRRNLVAVPGFSSPSNLLHDLGGLATCVEFVDEPQSYRFDEFAVELEHLENLLRQNHDAFKAQVNELERVRDSRAEFTEGIRTMTDWMLKTGLALNIVGFGQCVGMVAGLGWKATGLLAFMASPGVFVFLTLVPVATLMLGAVIVSSYAETNRLGPGSDKLIFSGNEWSNHYLGQEFRLIQEDREVILPHAPTGSHAEGILVDESEWADFSNAVLLRPNENQRSHSSDSDVIFDLEMHSTEREGPVNFSNQIPTFRMTLGEFVELALSTASSKIARLDDSADKKERAKELVSNELRAIFEAAAELKSATLGWQQLMVSEHVDVAKWRVAAGRIAHTKAEIVYETARKLLAIDKTVIRAVGDARDALLVSVEDQE